MHADLIVHNARIYTLDPGQAWAQAVACTAGRIQAVGKDDEVLALAGPRTQRIDAGGRLVLPGLTDSHVHFLNYAMRRQEVSLFGVRHIEEVRRRVRQAVERTPPGGWVLGWGYDEIYWDKTPHRALLDDIAPETPVLLRRMDMHSWWVNSAALRLANVTRATPDMPDSRIERDPDGEPTGVMREWYAMGLIQPHLPEPDQATLLRWLSEAIAEAHRLGLTGIQDQRVQREGQLSFRLCQELVRRNQFDLRMHMNVAADYLDEAASLGLQAGFGGDRLWIGHVKTFADGSMGSRTATMLEPFEGEPGNYGVEVVAPAEIARLARRAEQAGLRLAVHAIGDRAVREVLDVFEALRREGAPPDGLSLPHRIEHVQVIHPADLPRLSSCGVVASMQPVHVMTDWVTADRVWGRRARYAYAFRSLLQHGARLTFGSDAPVAPLNPMLGIYAALTRQDEQGEPQGGWYPEERLTLAEAIYGYTMAPALVAGKQHLQGSVTPGKWADLTILSANLFELAPTDIKDVTTYMTIFDGRVVYSQE